MIEDGKKYSLGICQRTYLNWCTLDENNLRLYFRKGKLLISVGMIYGNEVISRFTGKQLSLEIIMEKVFSKLWDDIWLVFNLAIPQRAMLLEC
jgi:radical SAM superfamily enzyme YgiQ (UPF0313 family)